jgi:hypothetical protein
LKVVPYCVLYRHFSLAEKYRKIKITFRKNFRLNLENTS